MFVVLMRLLITRYCSLLICKGITGFFFHFENDDGAVGFVNVQSNHWKFVVSKTSCNWSHSIV